MARRRHVGVSEHWESIRAFQRAEWARRGWLLAALLTGLLVGGACGWLWAWQVAATCGCLGLGQ